MDIGTKYRVYRFVPVVRAMARLGLVGDDILRWVENSGKPPPNLKRWNLRKRLPIRDESVDFVYCAETIEHLEFYTVRQLVSEIYRTLRPGGLLRVTTPDIMEISKAYLDGSLDAYKFNCWFYVDRLNYYQPKVIERIGSWLYSTKYHVWLYDLPTLKKVLEEAGFSEIERLEPKRGALPDLNLLENYSEPDPRAGRTLSMYVEARKLGVEQVTSSQIR